jgi:hypothetical protein
MMLHVLNGDSTRMTIERSGIPGEFLVWPDVLYEGPTPLVLGHEWVRTRGEYLGPYGDDGRDILREYRDKDAKLESFVNYDEVVFWFEHDLFDQLLLIRHLWWLGVRSVRLHASGASTFAEATADKPAGQAPSPKLTLVCIDRYLGMLPADAFPPLFEARRPITAAQVTLGSRAWESFCGSDPNALLSFTTAVSPDLPFLAGALLRYLQEFPSASNGLTRTETEILRALTDMPRSPADVFRAVSSREERIFMGDSSFWTIVLRLARARHPLVGLDIAPRKGRLPDGLMRLTETGAAVLAGRADHVALNGIDRWMGGVHLTSDRLWRWTGTSLRASS